MCRTFLSDRPADRCQSIYEHCRSTRYDHPSCFRVELIGISHRTAFRWLIRRRFDPERRFLTSPFPIPLAQESDTTRKQFSTHSIIPKRSTTTLNRKACIAPVKPWPNTTRVGRTFLSDKAEKLPLIRSHSF